MSATQTYTETIARPEPVRLDPGLIPLMIEEPREPHPDGESFVISRNRTWAIIVCVASATAIGSFLNGVVSVSLPALASDIKLDPALLLWPASIFSLTSGCTLLLCGALGDLLGARNVYATGCFFQAVFNMACGLATSGTQMISFRGFSGVAISMCLPTAVSLITNSFPPGKKRNIAFACMGGGQTVGFSTGLSLGGVFVDTIGWRCALSLVVALQALPRSQNMEPITWNRVLSEVDWIGALLVSITLSMSSYVLASITRDIQAITKPANITLLALSAATAFAFVFWVGRRERLGQSAIIPNSLWKNRLFSCVCLTVFLVLGACNATETLSSFFYQYVQGLSATATSVRLLPSPIGGALANALIALTVHRVRADLASFAAVALALTAPILMTNTDPSWVYWVCCFPAMLINSVGVNTIYTISNLVITSLFPSRTQGVAGGVYNTIAQLARSIGLTTSALIATTTTARLGVAKDEGSALLTGYRAAFWYSFALYVVALMTIWWGLRNVGKVGVKKE